MSLVASPLPRQALNFLYHHVFLPPELPRKDDFHSELDLALMRAVEDGLATLKKAATNDQQSAVAATIDMLKTMQSIHPNGDVETAQLLKAFSNFFFFG